MYLVKATLKFNTIHSKLDRLVKRNERVLQEALQKWFAFTVKTIQTDLRTKFQKDITSELTDWTFIEDQGKKIIKPATLSIMQSGGNEAYKVFDIKGAFDVLNPESVSAAEKFTAKLVREVNGETKRGIRSSIAAGVKEGKSMARVAKDIRPLVGLTQNQAQSVSNYKTFLQDKEKFPNLSAADIDKKTNKYAAKTHRRRAQTIARTETAMAQNIGYAQGMESLGIEQLEFSRAPATGPPDECDALEGKRFSIAEAKGIIPVHPNGRCAMLPVIGNKSVRDIMESVPSSELASVLSEELVSDLVKRWGTAVSRSNKWVLKDKLRKLGYDTSGKPLSGVRPPIVAPPTIAPPVLPSAKLPQEIQDLISRWKTAQSRSSKWVSQNKLKQLGYDVKTGIYTPTGAPLPKPRVKPTPKPEAVEPAPKPKPAEGVKYSTADEYRTALLDLEKVGRESTAASSKITGLKEKRSTLYRKHTDVRENRASLKASGRGTQKQLDDLWNELTHMVAEGDKLTKEIGRLGRTKKVSQKQMHAVLNEDNNLKGLMKGAAKQWESTADDILSWMPRIKLDADDISIVKNLRVVKAPGDKYLGSYSKVLNQITMSVTSKSTFAHEFGHHLSYNLPSIMRKQNAFFKLRTAGEAVGNLGGGYKKLTGKKDKFAKVDRYAGRIYSNGDFPEVISVGLEHLWKSPITFAKKDAEWFNMVVSALKQIPSKASGV